MFLFDLPKIGRSFVTIFKFVSFFISKVPLMMIQKKEGQEIGNKNVVSDVYSKSYSYDGTTTKKRCSSANNK